MKKIGYVKISIHISYLILFSSILLNGSCKHSTKAMMQLLAGVCTAVWR